MERRAYFNSVSDQWDDWNREADMLPRLERDLHGFGIRRGERVLDLGCGTGILFEPLLDRVGPEGMVEGVDYARFMVERAAGKHSDARLAGHVADAAFLPFRDGSVDRIVCFSTWPHFPDPQAVLVEAHRVLRPAGILHVWHVDGRDRINAIHRDLGGAVGTDLLVPAALLAAKATRVGFEPLVVLDEDDRYLVSLRRSRM